MEKNIFYRAIIIVLIIFNLGSLGYIYLEKRNHLPRHERREGPKKLIIERLGFDLKQQKKYEAYIEIHQNMILSIQKKRVSLKNELYSLLKKSSIEENKKDSLIQLITESHQKVEQIHFHHFEEIKSICKGEEQLKKFNNLSKDFSNFFAPPPMKRHKKYRKNHK